MTQALTKENHYIKRFKKFSPEKQQQVLDFVEFLQFQSQKKELKITGEKE